MIFCKSIAKISAHKYQAHYEYVRDMKNFNLKSFTEGFFIVTIFSYMFLMI